MREVHLPEEFAAYAPRTALDMVKRLPSFTLDEGESQRGIGQASGNVILNGLRPSGKTESVSAQLDRIPAASVVRIEIVDGASLDIPGLTGRVANVIYKIDNLSGQFAWRPELRTHGIGPLYTKASASVSGRNGALQYEFGVANDNGGRRGSRGPAVIRDGAGMLIETRDDSVRDHEDRPKLSTRLTYEGANGSIAHLNAHYQWVTGGLCEDSTRLRPGQPPRFRLLREHFGGNNWELGGDWRFALGPGKLKLVGLANGESDPYWQAAIQRRDDGSLDFGERFAQTLRSRENIARGEYEWAMLGGDWQLSAEGAFNTLSSRATIGTAAPDGSFDNLPFPQAIGHVAEDRYESLISHGRVLGQGVTLQLVAGAEYSTIRQTGHVRLTRRFLRPKGSLALAWQASRRTDLSFKVERSVGQLSFADFLAQAFIDDGTANAGNSQLRPQQEWAVTGEVSRKFGPWGSAKLHVEHRRVEDYVDFVPIGEEESIGNIAHASLSAVQLISAIEFAPLGWKGARLDVDFLWRKSRLRDPFTQQMRPWSGAADRRLTLDLRHDIPGSPWAWGGYMEYVYEQPQYRRRESDRLTIGPVFAGMFVEHKNVMGLTVRALFDNVTGSRELRDRIVYEGLRGMSPVRFTETRRRNIGPIIRFTVTGSF